MPDETASSLDSLLKKGRSIIYNPRLSRLTGNPWASILLQQICFWWQRSGCQPFYKYATPCRSSRPGDSWVEELGWSRWRFEAARHAP